MVLGAALGACIHLAGRAAWAAHAAQEGCRVVKKAKLVELHSPAFVFCLDTSAGLRAQSWENRITGRKITLSGAELEIDVDTLQRRIGITGWKFEHSPGSSCGQAPDEDPGYRAGFARADYDDSSWRGVMNLTTGPVAAGGFSWARTRVSIPTDAQDKQLRLTLGGFGLFDHRTMRVFLGGVPIAERSGNRRWRRPLEVDLGPGSAAGRNVRFGQDNVIAVQLSGYVGRLARLDELDPEHRRALSRFYWPAQFEQYLTVGHPVETLDWQVSRPRVRNEGARDLGLGTRESALFSLTPNPQSLAPSAPKEKRR